MVANISGHIKLLQTQTPSLVVLVLKAGSILVIGFVIIAVADKTGWVEIRKGWPALFYVATGFLAGGIYGLRAGWCKGQPHWQISVLEKACFTLGYLSGVILIGSVAFLYWLGV